jgi:hypothetical protein
MDVAGRLTLASAWAGLALEVIDFAAKPLGVPFPPAVYDGLEKFGILLFLFALIGWLDTSNKKLEKVDQIASEIRAVVEQGRKIDFVARYGAGAATLARLLSPDERDGIRFPHCLAGGQTLSELILETYSQAAEQFHRFSIGGSREVTLTESSVINLFLTKLMERLPRGSVWLGTSRLQDQGAWVEGSAEPAYSAFLQAAADAIKDRQLTYLLVFCFDDLSRCQKMSPVAKHRSELGLDVRCYVRDRMPDDFSLIWVPKAGANCPLRPCDPNFYETLDSNFQALCGLRFGIRAFREVSKMNLVGLGNEFDELKSEFMATWKQAKDYQNFLPSNAAAPATLGP